MQVQGNKAFATLTDVKNLIGDVFSLADKHGEVTITSYNKPKYVIKRLNKAERETIQTAEATEEQPQQVAVPAAQAPQPQPAETPAPAHPLQQPTAASSTLPTLIAKLHAIFKDLDYPDLWDRISPREQTWVQNARDLL
jgi:hypothetical protein